MPSKEDDIFTLKLKWISSKDEAERKELSERIRRLLTQKKD